MNLICLFLYQVPLSMYKFEGGSVHCLCASGCVICVADE